MAKTVNLAYTRKTAPVRIDVVQYTTAPDIVFIIEDFTPMGRADIYIDKPSGEEIYNSCTIDGNKVIFTPTTQCFAEVGENKAQLQFLDGDKLAVSFPLTFVVAENIIDSDAAESTSEFTELQAAISTIGQYDQRIADVQQEMSDLNTELTDDMAALQTDITNDMAALSNEVNTQLGEVSTSIAEIDDILPYKLGYIRKLTNVDNLDALTEPGIYYYATSSPPQGAPFNNAAIVEVMAAPNNGTYALQRVTRVGVAGISAYRTLDVGQWRTWALIESMTEGIKTYDLRTAGYITNNSKRLSFTVPTSQLYGTVSIGELAVTLRHIEGGYPWAANGTGALATMAQLGSDRYPLINEYGMDDFISGTSIRKNDSCISINVEFVEPLRKTGDATITTNIIKNNVPIGVEATVGLMVDVPQW